MSSEAPKPSGAIPGPDDGFISVADVTSLPPGHGRSFHLDGREFALWYVDGEFYCMDDQCPHRGGPLGAGQMQNGQVFCPLHGWAFDVRTGACEARPDRPVKMHPTRVKDGQVQIRVKYSRQLGR